MYGQKNLDSLLQTIKTQNEDTNYVNNLNAISRLYSTQSLDSCYNYGVKALEVARKLGYMRGTAEAYRSIGISFMIRGAADLAMENYLAALDEMKKCSYCTEGERAQLHNNVATVYMSKGQYRLALTKLNEVIKLMKGLPDKQTVVRHNIGICYDYLGKPDSALLIFKANAPVQDSLHLERALSSTYNSIGQIYLKAKNYAESVLWYRKSKVLKEKLHDTGGLSNLFTKIGALFNQTGQLDSAEYYLLKSREYAQTLSSKPAMLAADRELARLRQAQGKTNEAILLLESVIDAKDSLHIKENETAIENLGALYRLKQKDAEVEVLNAENEANKYFLYGLGIILALLLLGIFLLLRNARSKARSNRQLQDFADHIESQKTKIASQGVKLIELHNNQEGLMNMMAHDLKAPLNRTVALLQLIRNSGAVSAEQEKYMALIERSVSQGQRLIEDLLSLNHLESGSSPLHFADSDLREFMNRFTEGYKGPAKDKRIQLNYSFSGDHSVVHTDLNALERVLDNLVSNALKFSKPETEVRIETHVGKSEWFVKIRDQGPGISAEEQKKLFGKFQRLSARPTGNESSTGLGLAIVKLLVTHLKGAVTVESEVGKGSTFTVKFHRV